MGANTSVERHQTDAALHFGAMHMDEHSKAKEQLLHEARAEATNDHVGPTRSVLPTSRYPESHIVDPIKRDAWIYDGNNRHEECRHRCQVMEEVAAARSANIMPHAVPRPYVTPSITQLDGIGHQYASATSGLSGWRGIKRTGFDWRDEKHHLDPTSRDMWKRTHAGTPTHDGMLPAISQLIKDDRLPEKSKGQIEAEIRQSDRLKDARLFDKSGGLRP